MGLAAFAGMSLICVISPTSIVLVIARIGQGAAAAGMLPQIFSVIQPAYRDAARERAVALYYAVLALGVVLGQALVTANLFDLGWRAPFVLTAIAAVGALGGVRRLPDPRSAVAVQLDLAGAALLSVAIASLMWPLLFGRQDGWPRWVWPVFGCATVFGLVFVQRQRSLTRHGRSPLLDLSILTLPGVARRLTAACVVMGAYAGMIFALTFYLQSGLGLSASGVGLTFAPDAIGFASASLLVSRASMRYRLHPPCVGSLTLAAGFCLAASLTHVLSRGGRASCERESCIAFGQHRRGWHVHCRSLAQPGRATWSVDGRRRSLSRAAECASFLHICGGQVRALVRTTTQG